MALYKLIKIIKTLYNKISLSLFAATKFLLSLLTNKSEHSTKSYTLQTHDVIKLIKYGNVNNDRKPFRFTCNLSICFTYVRPYIQKHRAESGSL